MEGGGWRVEGGELRVFMHQDLEFEVESCRVHQNAKGSCFERLSTFFSDVLTWLVSD